MLKRIIVLFISTLLLTQCTEVVKPAEEEIGRDYFPLAIGNFWIYDVTETTFNNKPKTSAGDSVNYQVRERIAETYTDQSGQLTYKIIRSRRTLPSAEWGQDSLVIIHKLQNSVQISHNNIKTINLIFPVTEGKTWNGNAFNNRGTAEFIYNEVGNPFTIRDTVYDKTVRVIQAYDKNIINFEDQQEVYAYGVGLIYKRVIDYNYCDGSAGQGNCPFDAEFIVRGVKKIQRLRAFEIVK